MSEWTDRDSALVSELSEWAEQMERDNTLGARVKKRRVKANWSLEEFANQTAVHLGRKVHFTTLSKIEKSQRKPSSELLSAMASALGATAEELTGEYTPYINEYHYGVVDDHNLDERVGDPEPPKAWLMGPDIGDASKAFAVSLGVRPLHITLKDGAYALIDASALTLEDGKIFAIRHGDGNLSFRRFRALPPQLDSVSGDPSDAPLSIGREPFTVIGRLAWVCSRVD